MDAPAPPPIFFPTIALGLATLLVKKLVIAARKGFWFDLTCVCSLYMFFKALLIFGN